VQPGGLWEVALIEKEDNQLVNHWFGLAGPTTALLISRGVPKVEARRLARLGWACPVGCSWVF